MHWQGKDYPFDLEHPPIAELRAIKKHKDFGFTYGQLIKGIYDLDVDAVACLYWMVMRSDRGHDDLVLSLDLITDAFPLVDFVQAWTQSQDEGETEENPTQADSRQDTQIQE